MASWQKPGPSGTAGVHKDIPVDAYNLSPDGTLVATPWAHMDTFRPPAKVLHKSAFAAELECTEKNTRHWIHRWCVEYNNGQPAMVPDILKGTGLSLTVPNCISVAAVKHSKLKCMGVRPIHRCVNEKGSDGKNKQFWNKGKYEWRTYSEIYNNIQNAACGLALLPDIQDQRLMRKQVVAALLAETSQEWMIAAQAALACGLTLTTVYATLGHEAMLHGLNQTEAQIIFLDWGLFNTLKDTVLAKCPALRHIVFIGKDLVPWSVTEGTLDPFPSPPAAAAIKAIGEAHCTTLDNVIKHGQYGKHMVNLQAMAPEHSDIAMIMYTSGSTGLPKGVVLTHLNFVSVIASAIAQGTILPKPTDIVIAYLPLAHILELLVECVSLTQGAAIGYAHPRTLTASSPYIKSDKNGVPLPGFETDLQSLQPTLMAAVPAILDLIANGLKQKFSKGCGFCSCLDTKIITTVKRKIGLANVRLLISGGAPLSSETQEFIQAIFAPVAQGYGATETAACATVQECFAGGKWPTNPEDKHMFGPARVPDERPADKGGGRVGAIQPANEIKLLSVEEMGYLVTDSPPRGEILVAGHNVSQHGYYKMPEETAKSFILHPDGKIWFHTGDIGVMDGDGVLRIIDRVKDLIKLSGGEYVSLGKVEANLKQVQGVGACCVFARSDKSFCVAIVSQPEKGWSSVGGRPDKGTLLANMKTRLKELGLATFEVPQQVEVDDTIWTPESGLVTASMKLQRNALRKYYNPPGNLLDRMGYRFPDKYAWLMALEMSVGQKAT